MLIAVGAHLTIEHVSIYKLFALFPHIFITSNALCADPISKFVKRYTFSMLLTVEAFRLNYIIIHSFFWRWMLFWLSRSIWNWMLFNVFIFYVLFHLFDAFSVPFEGYLSIWFFQTTFLNCFFELLSPKTFSGDYLFELLFLEATFSNCFPRVLFQTTFFSGDCYIGLHFWIHIFSLLSMLIGCPKWLAKNRPAINSKFVQMWN